jgi:hypothetical protein
LLPTARLVLSPWFDPGRLLVMKLSSTATKPALEPVDVAELVSGVAPVIMTAIVAIPNHSNGQYFRIGVDDVLLITNNRRARAQSTTDIAGQFAGVNQICTYHNV